MASTLELRPNAQAPVHRLPVREMLDGVWWRADFTLVEGQVVHDYLAPGGSVPLQVRQPGRHCRNEGDGQDHQDP
jgi:hypothetical protein